jgi:wyosine [tRNA(Phe)-imidazoG37] synthetase (radical SAM superfamily)
MIMEIQDRSGGAANAYSEPQTAPLFSDDTAFGYPRDFLDNRFVYLVISPRARGLSIGVNLNPVVKCNFHCVYCEVDRQKPPLASNLHVEVMAKELACTLELAHQGKLRRLPRYASLPDELLQVRHVALSGDGEPTLAPNFVEAAEAVVHIRALGRVPFFKIVLLTNSTALDQPAVKRGLKYLTHHDEIWAKLDAGSQEYLNKINGSNVPLTKIAGNILTLGRERPIVIQSLFPAIHGSPPSEYEILQYALQLQALKRRGAKITLVQIYSANRPMAQSGCTHLSLKSLSRIAQTVREIAGLRAEVF